MTDLPGTPSTRLRHRTARVIPVSRGLARARASTPVLYLVAALAYASFGTVFQVLPPFFDDLGRELGVGRTLTGLSMTAFLAPVALTSLFLGTAVDRHGPARVGRLGFALLLGGIAAAGLAVSARLKTA